MGRVRLDLEAETLGCSSRQAVEAAGVAMHEDNTARVGARAKVSLDGRLELYLDALDVRVVPPTGDEETEGLRPGGPHATASTVGKLCRSL
jgi:hypothetical protein